MHLHLFTIEINFGSFLDGWIIKVEDKPNNSVIVLYIQKWLKNFMKDLWINLKCKDWLPMCLANMNTIFYKKNQKQKLETNKIVELTWNPK